MGITSKNRQKKRPGKEAMMHKPAPTRTPFWTPGVLVMLAFMIAGAVAIIARFTGGIGYVANLSTARPWGLWVGVDVATGVALAAGGFTTAAWPIFSVATITNL